MLDYDFSEILKHKKVYVKKRRRKENSFFFFSLCPKNAREKRVREKRKVSITVWSGSSILANWNLRFPMNVILIEGIYFSKTKAFTPIQIGKQAINGQQGLP